jgi:hypothetical protein
MVYMPGCCSHVEAALAAAERVEAELDGVPAPAEATFTVADRRAWRWTGGAGPSSTG